MPTLDDSVVEPPGTVTALIQGSTTNPPVYLTGVANHATVTVSDNDVAAFTLAADATEVGEGGVVRVTITADGVTFAEPQTITLTLGGTATPVDDFTLSEGGKELSDPYAVTLPAGARSVRVTIMAATDAEDDPGETIELSVSHDGSCHRERPPSPSRKSPSSSRPSPPSPPAAVAAAVARRLSLSRPMRTSTGM